ncbi:c-type cytochrome [Namhaeicola litoreus]|uniref:C-type cytochrome n=1 Tax=Namhaeicola litoreus TaxID=1052145 RepID=A0ABW3XYE5_9FLAO
MLKKMIFTATFAFFMLSCGGEKKENAESAEPKAAETPKAIDPKEDKGVGPITSLSLGEIDPTLAATGEELFKNKCTACHKIEKRFVGPALKGITEKRTPEWIMNMILVPEKMVAENEAAKQLLAEYLSPMANQSLTEEEARAILEYFRTQK